MIPVLFDFDIDPSIPHPYPKPYYDKIKDFFIECYGKFSRLFDIVLQAGHFPIILLSMTEEKITIKPCNIPEFALGMMQNAVKGHELETLHEELDTILNLHGGSRF